MTSRSTRSLAAVAALLLGLLAVGAGGTAARAEGSAGSVSWTVRTALSKYGADRPRFSYTVRPGEAVTDGIDIANHGSAPITLKVYAADAFTTDAGGFDILTPDKTSTGVGRWVVPATDHVTLAPGVQTQIPFTMTVPAGATPGDHLGGIVTVLDQPDSSRNGTVIHQRVGLRITARVSGKVTTRLAVEGVQLQHTGHSPFGTGRTTVTYTVHNTGNTVVGGLQKVTVGGELGASARTVDVGRLPNLLPGERWTAKTTVDDVRAYLWLSATVRITPVVTDAAGSTRTLPDVTATARSLVSLWSLALLIGLVLVIVVAARVVVVLLKRRRRRAQDKVEAKVAAAVEDALKGKAGR